jgi:hypothetical protein
VGSAGGTAYDGGAVTNPFLAPDGAVGAPGYAFTNDSDTGFYWTAAGPRLYVTHAGGNAQRWGAGDTTFYDSTTGNITATINDDGGTFRVATNTVFQWGAASVIPREAMASDFAGSITTPNYSFNGDDNTGYYRAPAGEDTGISGNGKGIVFFDYVSATEVHVELEDDADLVFEGATDDANETTLGVVDPTADRTQTLQDASGEVPLYQYGTSSLADGSGSATVRIPLTSGDVAFGQIHYNVTCTDGTNIVVMRVEHEFVCANDATVESCTHSNNDLALANIDFAEESIGTASIVDYDALFNSSVDGTVDLAVDIDCSLTPTVFEAAWEIEFARGSWRTATEQN